MPENLDWKPINAAPEGLAWKSVQAEPAPSILSETLKAPARVVGGIAQEAGEAAQYVTGDRVGMGIRKWGEGVQERNAQTPAFREAHPIISTAGDVAEGVAKMAPYLAADLAVSAVAPEVGLPAGAGMIARGIRAVKAAPFATTVLPAVAGASQGQRSYEKGVENGMTSDEALAASTAPALVTGAGMVAMGALSHGLQEVGGAAKTLKGQFVKHAAADTGIMMAQGVATSAAEKATGIDPEAKPLDQLKDPKAWLHAAMTGGMFAGLGVAKKGIVARSLKAHLDALGEAEPQERQASVEALASAVHPDDPAAQAAFQADTLDKIQAGESVLSEELVNELTKESPVEETREAVLDGLKATIESGGEVDPIEAHNDVEASKVADALRSEAPTEPVKLQEANMPGVAIPPEEPVSLLRARRALEQGHIPVKEGGMPDAEVAAHLDDMGYTLVQGDRLDLKDGGVPRRAWRVEKNPAEPILGDTGVGMGDPEGFQALLDSAKAAVDAGNYDKVTTTKGEEIHLVHITSDLGTGESRVLALTKDGELAGDLQYVAGTMDDGTRFNPFVHVDEKFRRKGVATALYDAAEKRGGLIPDIDQHGQLRTPDGQAFRDARAGRKPATPAPQDLLADGEVRRLGDREALARQGDTLILGFKNAEGGWDHVAKAEKNAKGEFEVNASEAETPEAAARMVSVLTGLRPEARLSRGAGSGLPKAEIEAHLKDIIAKLKVSVEVVNSASEIEGLRPEAPKFNGAFHKGKIYLNAEHLTSLKEAEEVLLKHELAHAGLLGSLGRDGLDKVLAKAWGDLKSGVREFAKEKGIDTKTKAGKLEATEEFLVDLAQKGSKHPLWDKFVATLKAAMRKLGFDMKFSERELRSLVLDATRSMTVADGPTRFSRLYRGDSVHEDGLGEGSMGDLGRGHYFTDAPHVAEYFTDGTDKAHTRAFEVDLKKPFDLMDRNISKDPAWRAMLDTLPPDPEIGVKNRENLEAWAAGKLDVHNNYGFLARSFGQTPETFNDFLAKFGYDGVSDQGVRGVSDGGTQYVAFDKAAVITAKFNRVATEAKPKDVDEASSRISTSVIKRVLSNTVEDVWRTIMPLDKTMTMAASMKEYAPIAHQFARLQELAHGKRAAGSAPSIEAQHLANDFARVIRTDAAVKAYNDLTNKATLYELHADPSKPLPWTEKSWKEAGKQKQTGLSLGEAVAEVRAEWAKLTPEQQEVQQRAVAHMKELKAQEIEAQIEVLKANPLNEPIFDQAEKIAEDLHAKLWKAEQMGGAEAAGQLRAELSSQHGSDVMDLADEIAGIRSEGRLKGDYAPLMRYGDHAVSVHELTEGGAGKRLSYQRFESQKDAEDFVARTRAEGKHVEYSYDDVAARAKANIPPAFMDKLRRGLEAQGITGEAQERVMQDFMAARVSSMPRVTLAGNKLNREGIAGYDENALRAYATYVRNASRAIANLKYNYKLEQEFRDMRNNIKAYQDPEKEWSVNDVQRMSSLQSMLETSIMSSDVQRINDAVKTLGKSTFLWYLSSPSVWAVQWSQPFVTTIPKMASRYGFGTAFAEYVRGAKNHMAGRYSDEKIDAFDRANGFVGKQVHELTEKYREAGTEEEKAKLSREMKAIYDRFSPGERELLILKVMSHQGGIDLSAAHSQDDLINSSNALDRGLDKVVDKAGVFMRASETGSRRAAAVSAFALALKDKKDFMEANRYANHIINDTLFDFDSSNRPKWVKGNVGRVVGQFQFFRTHMLGKVVQLAKDAAGEKGWGESRKELAYMVGTSMALAGAGGTPLAMLFSNTATDALWGALSFLFGDPDDPWDPKADFEEAMRDAVGDEATNTFTKGLPYLLGMDISQRVGLGGMADLVQGEVPAGASSTEKANWYAAKILGPSWGLVASGIKTADALGQGDYGTAAQAGSPKVLRDFLKAYDLTEEGAKGAGGRTVVQAEDVSPYSVALQMVGINPSEMALAQEESRELSNLSTELKQRRSLLMKRVTEATLAGDMDARDEALEAINAWGQKQPALKVTHQELANAVKRGMMLKAGKLPKKEEALKAQVEG